MQRTTQAGSVLSELTGGHGAVLLDRLLLVPRVAHMMRCYVGRAAESVRLGPAQNAARAELIGQMCPMSVAVMTGAISGGQLGRIARSRLDGLFG